MRRVVIGALGLLHAGCGPRGADVPIGSDSEAALDTGSAPDGHRRCGNELAPEAWSSLQADLAGDPRYQGALAASRGGKGRRAGRDIDVYVYVFHNGNIGRVATATVELQIDVLNYDFAYTGWRFNLAALTNVDDGDLHACVRDGYAFMPGAPKAGEPGDLNLYLCDAEAYLGITLAFPWDVAQTSRWDGVIVDWRALPGGPLEYYDRGHTATHEIGHWMGLYHTFEGMGCTGGDEVDDTPTELRPSWGCDLDRDSCPGEGLNPVQNFMDYADDDCMSEFSPGQAARMDAMYAAYRD